MNICVIIPNYNHKNIADLFLRLEPYDLPCIVIDDGSDYPVKQELESAAKKHDQMCLITLEYNQGKGAAVLAGLKYAATQNYTHAIQIDADFQHDINDLPKFLTAMAADPSALISGQPIYDHTVPKSRLYGRKITDFWIRLETLSTDIKDAMCGYRVYPIQKMLQIVDACTIGKRMDFDIEIMVRAHWEKINIVFIPTKVTYSVQGVSHFRLLQDNLKISWLHARLFFGMLIRVPQILRGRFASCSHWSKAKEKGSLLGMNIMLYSYRFLGRRLTYLLLYPVVIYFYLFSLSARKASKEYFARLGYKKTIFKHLLSFAESIVDKLAVWNGDISLSRVEFQNSDLLRDQVAKKAGAVIFTAHLGNMEIMRALSELDPAVKINAILYASNAEKITAFLEKINPKFELNLFSIEDMGIAQAIEMQTKIDNGELIIIACDRTSVTKAENSVLADFLGDEACFPRGPFILAGILKCPVFFMLCLKEKQNSFKVVLQEFASVIDIGKANRDKQIKYYAQKYAQLLERYCRLYPLQWFNFFNFWKHYDK